MLDDEKIKLIDEQSKEAISRESKKLADKFREIKTQEETEKDIFIKDCYSKVYDIDNLINVINKKVDGKSNLLSKEEFVEIKFLEFKKQAILNKLNSL